MKRLTVSLAAGFLFLFANVCRADVRLEGTWKWIGSECSPGVPADDFGQTIDGRVEGTVQFSGDRLDSRINMQYRYKKEYAEHQIKAFEDLIATIESQPEYDEKKSLLAQSRNSLSLIHQFTAGVACQVSETQTFSVEDSELVTTPINRVSTCPGDTLGVGKPYRLKFHLVGDTLKLFAPEDELQDGGTCPDGKRATATIFQKIR